MSSLALSEPGVIRHIQSLFEPIDRESSLSPNHLIEGLNKDAKQNKLSNLVLYILIGTPFLVGYFLLDWLLSFPKSQHVSVTPRLTAKSELRNVPHLPEPFKIKTIQAIHLIPREERIKKIERAGLNLFQLNADTGKAMVIGFDGCPEDVIEEVIDECPVSCIHRDA